MAEYKLDGTKLTYRGSTVAQIDGRYFRDEHGNRRGELDGKYIRDDRGNRIGEVDGTDIRDSSGNRIGTINDVRTAIDGPGGATLAALWVLFVR